MQQRFLQITAIFGALAVLIGAFAAHGLKAKLSPEALTTFETGVKYHFYHTFALVAVCLLAARSEEQRHKTIFHLFSLGIVLFSGSLYIIATKALHGLELGFLGILTPIGGMFFIVGWLLLGFGRKDKISEMKNLNDKF